MGICRCTHERVNRLSPHGLNPNLLDLHKKDVDHSINRLQLGNLCGLLHGTKGNVLCAMTGLSTTLHSLTLCVPVSVKKSRIHHSDDELKECRG